MPNYEEKIMSSQMKSNHRRFFKFPHTHFTLLVVFRVVINTGLPTLASTAFESADFVEANVFNRSKNSPKSLVSVL